MLMFKTTVLFILRVMISTKDKMDVRAQNDNRYGTPAVVGTVCSINAGPTINTGVPIMHSINQSMEN